MILVFNLKKLRIPCIAALLFCCLTAIIIQRYKFSELKEVFSSASQTNNYTLIIDAGHGGADGGASSADGMLESDVNLAVAQKMEAISKLFGICPVMTRTTVTLDYPEEAASISQKKVWDQKSRVELVNSVYNGILISIHQNNYPDPRPSGSQVLFAATTGSKELGEITHKNLLALLCPDNRRVAAPISDKIFLTRNVNCPAILVECGFLSNPIESALLADDSYRTKIAAVLFASYLQFADSLVCSDSDLIEF